MKDTTDYKQIAYKLQDDIRTYLEDNLKFSKEMLRIAEKISKDNDSLSKELLIKMIEDSINWDSKQLVNIII